MANIHFGNIGDVWKHLQLAEVLALDQPSRYWESHSGSAMYHLTHSGPRDYGVYHFLGQAESHPDLAESEYHDVLQAHSGKYPGSPAIALDLLKGRSKHFLFFDLDGESTRSILTYAKSLSLSGPQIEAVRADGISGIQKSSDELKKDQIADTFIFIDPYRPFERTDHGLHSYDLFCSLAKRGAKTMYWFGYKGEMYRSALINALRYGLDAHQLSNQNLQVWCGEIRLVASEEPGFDVEVGVWGCGVLCCNLEAGSYRRMEELGQALEAIYADAGLPNGETGAIRFQINEF